VFILLHESQVPAVHPTETELSYFKSNIGAVTFYACFSGANYKADFRLSAEFSSLHNNILTTSLCLFLACRIHVRVSYSSYGLCCLI